MAYKPSEVDPPQAPAEPGLYLFVNVSKERVTVLHAARIERAPRRPLQPPQLLQPQLLDDLKTNASELVLAVLRETGKPIESFGWPVEAEIFADREINGRFGGAAVRTSDWDARLRIPVPDSARYLQFYRIDFVPGRHGLSPLAYTSLGVFDLKPDGPEIPVPDFPAHDSNLPVPLPYSARIPAKALAEEIKLRNFRAERILVGGGYIKESTTLVSHGPPEDKFNVVVVGDGFVESELDIFDHYALLVQQTLTTTLPFSNLVNRINVHKVTVVSTDSGISNCPDCGTTRNTYFNTTGCWHGASYAGFIGTDWKWRIMSAVETVIPQQYAHCVVTIVNCRIYGGSAPPELGIAFVTLPDSNHTDTMFMDLTAHESGHVIATLCEEYNPCNKKVLKRIYPNETTGDKVDAGLVWWQALAVAGEVDANGKFTVIHRVTDPVTTACQPIVSPPEHYSMLGAFWGCHNGEPPASTGDPCDVRGKDFYRSMAQCRMRNPVWEFCRVCSWLISESILEVST